MYPDINGKVAIVTGSGRKGGLGEAMAKRLAAEGAKLVIHDIGQTKGEIAPAHGVGDARPRWRQIAAEIRDRRRRGDRSSPPTCWWRMRSPPSIGHAVSTYGRIDILINNAGVGYMFGPLTEMTAERWNTVLNVNLRGSFFAMKHAAKQMIAQGAARVIGAPGGSSRSAAGRPNQAAC